MWRWIFLVAAFPLFGAYTGNPADPALMSTGIFSSGYSFFKFTSGYVGDYISDKRYQVEPSDPELDPDTFRHFGLHSQMATFSLILLERIEFFGMVGGSKEHAQWNKTVSAEDLSTILLDFHSAHHFSWSTGGNIVLLQWGQTFLSSNFTYFAVPASHKAYFKFLNRLNLPLEITKQAFSLQEWQVTAAISSRFFFITPYAGATYLHSQLHIHAAPDVPAIDYSNEKKIGYVFGVTFSLTGRFHVNLERRIRDEFAYAFSTIAVF